MDEKQSKKKYSAFGVTGTETNSKTMAIFYEFLFILVLLNFAPLLFTGKTTLTLIMDFLNRNQL